MTLQNRFAVMEAIAAADFTPSERLFLHVVLAHHFDGNECRPTDKRILALSGVKDDRVPANARRKAKKAGILTWTRERVGAPLVYHFHPCKSAGCEMLRVSDTQGVKCADYTPPNAQITPPQIAPLYSLEEKKKRSEEKATQAGTQGFACAQCPTNAATHEPEHVLWHAYNAAIETAFATPITGLCSKEHATALWVAYVKRARAGEVASLGKSPSTAEALALARKVLQWLPGNVAQRGKGVQDFKRFASLRVLAAKDASAFMGQVGNYETFSAEQSPPPIRNGVVQGYTEVHGRRVANTARAVPSID